jgi:hypothetical protein
MQLPEIFARGGFLLQLLNTIGLGILGAGLVTYYRALLARSETLKQGLSDLREAHESVVVAMDKRALENDARFEDTKKFQSFQMSMLEGAEVFNVKIQSWKESQLTRLESELAKMLSRMAACEENCRNLKSENNELNLSITQLESKCRLLEKQNQNLEIQAAYVQPGIKGVN